MAGRRSVSALGAVTRESVLWACVAETVAVHVAEVPGLAGEYGLETAGAVGEAGFDRGS